MSFTTPTLTGKAFSCLFPDLRSNITKNHSSAEGEASYHSVAFQLDLGLDIELFCEDNAIPTESVFQLAWGIVLNCLIGERDVAFGFLETLESRATTICMTFDSTLSAAEAARALQQTEDGDSPTEVNTLLHISRDSAGTITNPDILGSRVQDSHSNVSTCSPMSCLPLSSLYHSTTFRLMSTFVKILFRFHYNVTVHSLLGIPSWASQVLLAERSTKYLIRRIAYLYS